MFSSAIIYYTYMWGVLETGGLMGRNGKPFDLATYGILSVICLALQHHV